MDTAPGMESTASVPPSAHHGGTGHLLENLQRLHFPRFRHAHPEIINVNKVHDEQLTVGQKIADAVASFVGSWPFIIGQSLILATWVILNSIHFIFRWDPPPFILLNLMLSFQAAYAAPFVMMSQNRQAEKDRLTAQNDYQTDCRGEEEIRHIMEHLDHQDALILQLLQHMQAQREDLEKRLNQLDPETFHRLAEDVRLILAEREEQRKKAKDC